MDTTQILLDTADKIFADHCDKALLDRAEQGEFPAAFWGILKEQGLDQLGMPGSGTGLGDVFRVGKVAGYHAMPFPLSDFLIANIVCADATALRSIAHTAHGSRAAWGRSVDEIVVVTPDGVGRTRTVVEEGVNLAGEARDLVSADGLTLASVDLALEELLCLGRVTQVAGLLDRILELSLQFATERKQFGRTISNFQAIQHMLAVMAAEVAAATRIADSAIAAVESSRLPVEVAAAKSRVGEAVGVVAEHAHQVHGAMGFTHEHTLHHFTRRAWSGREEFGNEAYWQTRLGQHVADLGADAVWDFVATRG